MSILLYAKRIYFIPASEKSLISLENRDQVGVYALISKVTQKFYIGSSVYLGCRILDYMQPAYLTRRANSPVTRAIIKYGLNNFCFIVIETCELKDVLKREQYWLDFLQPEYNLSPTAGSTLGVALSEETKAKLSEALTGKVIYKGTIRELRFYLDNGIKLIRIIKIVEFEKKIEGIKLFGKSVEVWEKLKADGEREGNLGKRAFGKLGSNSSYGSFSLNLEKYNIS
jgi:group I intron endonuclease